MEKYNPVRTTGAVPTEEDADVENPTHASELEGVETRRTQTQRIIQYVMMGTLCIIFISLMAIKNKNSSEDSSIIYPIQLGPRPYFLVRSMKDSNVKDELTKCAESKISFKPSPISIGHRGASMMFPEHTLESYYAAIEQGAGIVECDVTFTQDRKLICRHSQCDLHTTTNVVTTELNSKCTVPFSSGVSPKCCTSDFTLEEIKQLCAKMESSVNGADTPEEYIGGVPPWRTQLYSYGCPKIVTHKEYISLIEKHGRMFTPELKKPEVAMPFQGNYTQEMFAQDLIDDYIQAGISPVDVWPQSFSRSDTIYWVQNTKFVQAISLEGNYTAYDSVTTIDEFRDYVSDLLDGGVGIIAPPIWMLLKLEDGKIVPSNYASFSKSLGFDIITWTLERSGTLTDGGGFYYQTVVEFPIDRSGDEYEVLDVLVKDVGIVGIFSDWAATVTFYANCMGLV